MKVLFLSVLTLLLCQCQTKSTKTQVTTPTNDTIIIDCNYSFKEATAGCKAPASVINQLTLVNVKYYSMDGKIHAGQILTNKCIEKKVKQIFSLILRTKFPIHQAIPIVKYHWNDKISMANNNTYSFCYRDISYSKHALGLAIDINPMQNPLQWSEQYSYREDQPDGACYNPSKPGTFTPNNSIVKAFRKNGFLWGRYFKRNNDDHHFELKNTKENTIYLCKR